MFYGFSNIEVNLTCSDATKCKKVFQKVEVIVIEKRQAKHNGENVKEIVIST